MKTKIALCLLLLSVSSCALKDGFMQKAHRPPGDKITGYGQISFGIPRDKAIELLEGKGQFVSIKGQDKPAVFWKEYQGFYEFDAWAYADKKNDKIAKIELISVNALNAAQNNETCKEYFRIFIQSFVDKYGPPDFPNKYKKSETGYTSTSYFTFSDSSSIRLTYDFDELADVSNPRCKIKISYNQPWASGG